MLPLALLTELAADRSPSAICTVVATKGSTPRKAGATMAVTVDGSAHGRIAGTIGGGAIEHAVRAVALEVIRSGVPILRDFALTQELGMCCGGQMTVFVEPLRPSPPAIILGAGHIGQSLARAAAQTGFAVTLCDPRPLSLEVALPASVEHIAGYEPEDLARAPFGPDAFVLVVTHDHQVDQDLAEDILKRSARWRGVVGSTRKALRMRARAAAKGFAPDAIEALRCPAGLSLGAETPDEIALAILAEWVAVRRGAPLAAGLTMLPPPIVEPAL